LGNSCVSDSALLSGGKIDSSEEVGLSGGGLVLPVLDLSSIFSGSGFFTGRGGGALLLRGGMAVIAGILEVGVSCSFFGTKGMTMGLTGCEETRVRGPVVMGIRESTFGIKEGASLGAEGPMGTRLMRRFSDVGGNAGGCFAARGGGVAGPVV